MTKTARLITSFLMFVVTGLEMREEMLKAHIQYLVDQWLEQGSLTSETEKERKKEKNKLSHPHLSYKDITQRARTHMHMHKATWH